MNRSLLAVTLLALFGTTFSQCRKQNELIPDNGVSVSLQREDLTFIQQQVAGRWRLSRITGGLCAACDHPVQTGSYMVLSAGHVTFGNDSLGVIEDGAISWAPASYFGSGYVFTGPSGNGYVPTELRKDTLLLQQYAADGVTYHYVR